MRQLLRTLWLASPFSSMVPPRSHHAGPAVVCACTRPAVYMRHCEHSDTCSGSHETVHTSFLKLMRA